MATLFLDLDGTLTDPASGILHCVQKVLRQFGHTPPPQEELSWVIGPALSSSFAKLGVADPEAALAAYRACYKAGAIFDCRLIPGIEPALAALVAEGHELHLATAKAHVFARQITRHFGLDRFLIQQFGPELNGTHQDKGELLAHALSTLGIEAQNCVMIGDRVYDIRAAQKVGMASVAVAWGYGAADELRECDALCAQPEDLPGAVAALVEGENV